MASDNTGLALGTLAGSLGKAYAAKKQREHDDAMKQATLVSGLVSSGLQNGTIQNPDEAFQFMMGQFKGGKGAKKGELPPQLKTVIGATTRAGQPPAGQMRGDALPPQGGDAGPAAAPPKFLTADQAAEAAAKREAATATTLESNKFAQIQKEAETIRKQDPSMSYRDALEFAKSGKFPSATTKFTPGVVSGKDIPSGTDSDGQAIDKDKFYRRVTLGDGTQQFVVTETPASEREKPGSVADFFAAREKELGHKLSSAEQLKAFNDLAKSRQAQTPAQRMAMQKELADYRIKQGEPTAEDVKALSQTVTIGDSSRGYFDLGSVAGTKEKNEASKAAVAAGLIPVSTKQADVLSSAQAASSNLDDFYGMIQSKLPADFKSRPLAQITTPLKQYVQEDDILASAQAFDTTVIPMLRAISTSGIGRITNKEIDLAKSARPEVTDTVAVAARKVEIVRKILKNGIDPILNRGGSTSAGGGAPQKPAAVGAAPKKQPLPDNSQNRVKAKQYLLDHKLPASDANVKHYLELGGQ